MGHKDKESKGSRWVQYTAGIYMPMGSGPIVSWDKKHVIYPDSPESSRSHSRTHRHRHRHRPEHIRDLVSVDVRTDDEAKKDTVEITYPRRDLSGYTQAQTQPQPQATTDEAVKKVVRFEESPKPALKKTETSESEATTPASSEAPTSSDSQTDEPPSPKNSKNKSKNNKDKEKKKEKNKEKEGSKSSESEGESTSECDHCVRKREKPQARKKTAKKAKKPDSDTEGTDESANETADETSDDKTKNTQKNAKGKGKGKAKQKATVDSSDGETQDEESAKDTDCSDDEDRKGKKKGKKNKNNEANKDAQKGKAGKKNNKKNESKGKEPQKESEKSEPDTEEDKKSSPKEKNPESKKYPDPFPSPHPRRPNLIGPVKAQVIHIERVTETPEDPIPNAYYDEENNVLRVYYGPVYGHHNQSLYPKRDPNQRPLPIGMPHPAQNPYYNGFDRRPDTMGLEHVPITQGMPVPAWNAFAGPIGYAACSGPFPVQPTWGPVDPNQLQNQGQNKGAFSLVNPAAAGAPSSKDQDVAGGNNVFPPATENPYLPKRTRSQFSNLGSNRAPSNASPRNSRTSKADDHGKAGPSSPQGEWRNSNGNGNGSGNGNGNGNGNGSRNGGESSAWGNQAPQENNTWGGSNGGQNCSVQSNPRDNQNTNWNNGNDNNNGGNAWPADGPADNQYTQNDNTNNSKWGAASQSGAPPAAEHNNVMPGSWNGASETIPAWGDATMAASTGGKVDASNW